MKITTNRTGFGKLFGANVFDARGTRWMAQGLKAARTTMRFDSTLWMALLSVAFALAISHVLGATIPQTSPLHSKVIAPYGFVATVVPQDISEIQDQMPTDTLNAVAAFRADAGPGWRFYVDRRSGAMALVEGQGFAWAASGGADLSVLEEKARDTMSRYPGLFRVPLSQLVLDERRSVSRGEFQSVVFAQVVDGVPVDGGHVTFRVSRGRLVQFGAGRILPFPASFRTPRDILSAAQARASLLLYLGGLVTSIETGKGGVLTWFARGVDEQGPYTGLIGQGWQPVLAYRIPFTQQGQLGSWEALVNARTGEVVRFVDAVDYAALVKGSVYVKTNCADPLQCVPGSTPEVPVTMPFTNLNFVGGTCSGDACYSNSAGAFEYPSGALAVSSSLDGKYIRMIDNCGPASAAAAAPANIDLGTSAANPPLNTNTDCHPATRESYPNSGAASGGAGDTHAARNCFYHLNLINQKARAYLPDNDWLKGTGGTKGAVRTLTNAPPACNAFWEGNTGQFVFMKVTTAQNCNNTGEIPDIFLHEFGHGLDQNDATGPGPNGGSREAMGDAFALLQGQDSCIGEGAFLASGSPWGNRAGYGTGSALCTGFRDLDYTRGCYHGASAGCDPQTQDPDAPQGSRSGPTPPPNPPDAGTPARWDHMIDGSPLGIADGKSNFYDCGGPEVTGCAGALDHGCHCESLIASQANWDFAKGVISQEFGGDIYASPTGPTEVSGWQYVDRLWYLTRDAAGAAYAATGPAPAGTTNGCTVDSWFSTYRFIDDDNGNLADGTPHAGILFATYDLHAIACGEAADPSNQATLCPAPLQAPVLSTCSPNRTPVQLSWTPSTGAARYRLLRNTLGCGSGFTPVGEVEGYRTYYEDADIAPGVTYYYSIQPVGQSASCYGQVSNCIAVTPASCGVSTVPPPSPVMLSTPADNQILVSWPAASGAGSYVVSRKRGNCSSSHEFVPIGVVSAPTSTFLDNAAIGGLEEYSYRIQSSDASCGSCPSEPSQCASIRATGSCLAPPEFGGLSRIHPEEGGGCAATLEWDAASSPCGSDVSYSVFRSTDPAFLPGALNLIASGLTSTQYADTSAVTGVRYFYVVRASDSLGNTDANTLRRDEVAVTQTPGPYMDNAGDAGTSKWSSSLATPASTWSGRPSDAPVNTTRVYATTPSGNYANRTCMALESQTIALGASPSLSFTSRYDIEPGWDGGFVEVATEDGGYGNWTKLTTINYPGVMSSPQTHPACGGAGFENGAPVFTGTLPAYAPFSGSLAAYANQRIRIRFLFGSDDSTNATGWFIDDITVTGATQPAPCIAEVSGRSSGHPLLVFKRPDGDLKLVFEDLGPQATSYNIYEGAIGTWYSHTGSRCHDTTSTPDTPAPGERTLEPFAPTGLQVYLLVSASSASAEGFVGTNSQGQITPSPTPSCGPTP